MSQPTTDISPAALAVERIAYTILDNAAASGHITDPAVEAVLANEPVARPLTLIERGDVPAFCRYIGDDDIPEPSSPRWDNYRMAIVRHTFAGFIDTWRRDGRPVGDRNIPVESGIWATTSIEALIAEFVRDHENEMAAFYDNHRGDAIA